MTRLVTITLLCLAMAGCRHNKSAVTLAMTDLEAEQSLSTILHFGMSPEQVKNALREAKLTIARGKWERSIQEFAQHGHIDDGTYTIGVVIAGEYVEWREFGESFGNIQFYFDTEGRLARVRMWRPGEDAVYPGQIDSGRDLVLDKGRYDKAREGDG